MAQRDEAGTDHLSDECGTRQWESPSDLAGGGCQSCLVSTLLIKMRTL